MRLCSLLTSFVTYANSQSHLEPLFPRFERTVCFVFQDECYSLKIARNGIELIEGSAGANQITFVYEDSLFLLLSGKVKLQSLIKAKSVTYRGTYRTMLLLESIFHMCKPMKVGA
ncbi:hypothetical protein BAMA_16070 [Bacillus manliponensis]|uniref:SCP2 domain-containing protein n=1 Tax=Bacillus manliponensis TaxID=574376 RepID=A0A073JQ99_9BACI|nr:hypothetical protein [Bacillus manliponensis]KEK17259.1 hypothetical protein BAMA_16070 [Bacillus manliponensis]